MNDEALILRKAFRQETACADRNLWNLWPLPAVINARLVRALLVFDVFSKNKGSCVVPLPRAGLCVFILASVAHNLRL